MTLSTMTRPSLLLLGALLATAGVLPARSAHADTPPQVFPLVVTSRLPSELTGTPEALTGALVTMLDGKVSDRSLDEIGRKLRCDIEVSTCLDRVARSLGTTQLVFGTLLITVDGKVRVKLVRFDSVKAGSEMFQRTFVLSAGTPRRLSKQLARSAAKMFGREVTEEGAPITPAPPTPPTPEPPAPPTTPEQPAPGEPSEPSDLSDPPTPTEPSPPIISTTPEPAPAPAPAADESTGGRITMGTWALLGGGALIAAGGGGFLYSAHDLRDQIQAAPRVTEDDLNRLSKLQDTRMLRDQIGTALAVGGGLVVAVGVMRAIAQLDRAPKEKEKEPSASLSLVPVSGGAAFVFSGSLR
jgi:hypothetical protein